MTTKTDYHLISELKSKCTPAQRGVVTTAEVELVRETLQISSRSNIELQNVRDMVAMLYGRWADSEQHKGDVSAAIQLMDAMSAITHIIDQEKVERGLPV